MNEQLTNLDYIEPSGNDLINKELEAKVECLTLKKPTYQKLYIQNEDYVDTIVIDEKEYKCSDIVKHEKALEIIKEKGISVCSVALHYDNYEEYSKSCFRQYNPLTQEEYELLKEVLL